MTPAAAAATSHLMTPATAASCHLMALAAAATCQLMTSTTATKIAAEDKDVSSKVTEPPIQTTRRTFIASVKISLYVCLRKQSFEVKWEFVVTLQRFVQVFFFLP